MKRGFYGSKRGISPVIATVLLIALMIALFVIIFWWATNFIQEEIAKFDKPIKSSCDAADISVSIRTSGELSVVNRGNIDLYGLDIQVDDGQGNKLTTGLRNKYLDKFPIRAGESTTFEDFVVGDQEKITAYPVLLGVGNEDKHKAYTCLENGININ